MNKLNSIGLVAAVALAGCATGSSPSQGPPKGGLHLGVDASLAGRASAFEAFTRRAGAIDATFSNPGEIARGLQTAAGYEPRELEASMIAYAALAAMQEPAFVAGVRAKGRGETRRLAADPGYALDLPGGGAAAARANAAVARRGEALSHAGAKVKKAAYSIQGQAWSKARVPNGPQRLAAVKRAAAYRAEPADRAALEAALSERGRRNGENAVVSRGVAVAALTLLGQDAQARALMNEPRSGQCLRMAKLNFHQCLAAAGTHYEDIYCLGVHAMSDPGQCVVEATKPVRSMKRAGL